MIEPTANERRLAITIGALILAAATDVSIRKAGGYGNDYARLLLALAGGVFTGAYLMGRAWSMSKVLAITIAVTLGSGESYNLWQTAERVINARESNRAPDRAKQKQHEDAQTALKDAEQAPVTSERVKQAKDDKKAADDAYNTELREGGRCKTVCEGLKAKADKAQAELIAALAQAEQMHQDAIDRAKADLDAHPLPASGTASSDETGVPVWVLDLISAALLSLGANGLAGALIAFGAHRSSESPVRSVPANDEGQSDYGMPSDFDAAKLKAMISGNSDILGNPPTPPKGGRRRGRKADKKVVDFSERFRERNGRAPSGGEIKAAFPDLPTSTAYDYSQRARLSA